MPANEYYDSSGSPSTRSQGSSAIMRAEFDLLETAFNKLPALSGNAAKLAVVNTGGTALTVLAGVGTAGQVLVSNGAGALPTFQTMSALSGITAAGAANTINNGDHAQRWNWSITTGSKIGFQLSENVASVGANSILVQIDTLAGSTATPFYVSARGVANSLVVGQAGNLGIGMVPGSTALAVRAQAGQFLFASITDSSGNNGLSVGVTANPYAYLTLNDSGGRTITIATAPNDLTAADAYLVRTGFGFGAGVTLSTAIDGDNNFLVLRARGDIPFLTRSGSSTLLERMRITAAGDIGIGTTAPAGLFDISGNSAFLVKASADAVGFALNARKSRGTVAAPTVITTGDDLLTISGYGYVGGTNTYQEAARITFDSTGTISDSATGIGGIIRFSTAVVGAELVEAMTVQAAGDVTIGLPSPATTAAVGFPQIPTMAGTPTGVPAVITGFTPMVYDTTNDKIWVYDYGAVAWKGIAVA